MCVYVCVCACRWMPPLLYHDKLSGLLTACPACPNTAAPHNCIGGSEVNCLPSMEEASLMFADPSKMQNMDGVPLPSHWYKAPVAFM